MTVSIVLRVADSALAVGRLAGEVEVVATGERAVVRSADELVAFLRGPAVADGSEITGAAPATQDGDR